MNAASPQTHVGDGVDQPRLAARVLMLGSLLMPAACSPTQNADGPRIRICGEWIGQANMVIGLTW